MFCGSPEFAVPALVALHRAGYDIVCVYCQPPKPAHRGRLLTKCAVHVAAEALGLPVRTPSGLKRDFAAQAAFAALAPDIAVVAAYGLILPRAMLDAPGRGCLNIHASLLPRWRGASPIHSAILSGDGETGITIMRMEEGLDTGPMLLREAVPIGPHTTTPELHDTLAELGARLILRALAENPVPVPQPDSGVTYAPKLTRADGRLDFSRDAVVLERQVRALTPWPGSFADFDGVTVKILEAEIAEGAGPPGKILDTRFTIACGTGALRLVRVQPPGKAPMPGDAYLRGHRGR